jgi:putative DNA primase/helicase
MNVLVRTLRRPCPQCDRGLRDAAMAITTDERGTVSYCHRCGYTEANNHMTAAGNLVQPKTYRPWVDKAQYLWNHSTALEGSIAATYLQRRGCRLPCADADLRYLPASGDYPHAMLARITDAITAEPISLHFTRLNQDGTKAGDDAKRLLAGQRKAGGVIRLWPDDAVTLGLAISEGIETALAAAHGFTPIWSCIDAGNLTAFPVLGGIETLTIVADNDEAGIDAAEQCAQRWADAGREAIVALPSIAGQDAADLVLI